jgi:hypothetical protein
MSMGDSKAQEVNIDGRVCIKRTPAKKLSASTKAKILRILQRNDINVGVKQLMTRSETYYVKDAAGNKLLVVGDAYRRGYYNIILDGVVVAEMDWFESDGMTTKEQQDIFDVLKAVQKKENLTRIKDYKTLDEIRAWKVTDCKER